MTHWDWQFIVSAAFFSLALFLWIVALGVLAACNIHWYLELRKAKREERDELATRPLAQTRGGLDGP